jgi:hypothetical protein
VILVEVKPHNIDLVAQLWVENAKKPCRFSLRKRPNFPVRGNVMLISIALLSTGPHLLLQSF